MIKEYHHNTVDLIGTENGKMVWILNGVQTKRSKLYFRHEKTWDDHMGNTPCGYYFLARFPRFPLGVITKRIYLCEFPGYR